MLTDEEIMKLYFERNENAIKMTKEKYSDYCTAISKGILPCKEDYEECLNETWLRAWNSIPPQKPRKLSSFLGRITRNISFDKYRADNSQKRGKGEIALILDELDQCIPSAFDADENMDNCELKNKLQEFITTLSHKDSVIFLHRYWYAKSMEEISAYCGINKNTVKASLFRSRKKLKAFLEKAGINV